MAIKVNTGKQKNYELVECVNDVKPRPCGSVDGAWNINGMNGLQRTATGMNA